MANKVDIIDVMVAVHRGELKVVEQNGYYLLEDTISGERVRLNISTVVRCKDCAYCTDRKKYLRCTRMGFNNGYQVKQNDFCSYGERESR